MEKICLLISPDGSWGMFVSRRGSDIVWTGNWPNRELAYSRIRQGDAYKNYGRQNGHK